MVVCTPGRLLGERVVVTVTVRIATLEWNCPNWSGASSPSHTAGVNSGDNIPTLSLLHRQSSKLRKMPVIRQKASHVDYLRAHESSHEIRVDFSWISRLSVCLSLEELSLNFRYYV